MLSPFDPPWGGCENFLSIFPLLRGEIFFVPNGLASPFRGSKFYFFSTFKGWVGGSDSNVENSTFFLNSSLMYLPSVPTVRTYLKSIYIYNNDNLIVLGEEFLYFI